MHNLLSNALLYGGSEVTLRLARWMSAEGAWIGIEIEDNGPGIPPADRAAVLSRFRRGQAGTAPHGMGLGLPVVREIAGLFGGRLELIHPQAGHRGLRAQILLPASEPPSDPTP